ncbi:unnamed protein product, partial [Chrysoparadoxa australica]
LFQDENGEPLGFFDAVVGGRSVGTPGTPALLGDMHRRWGRAPWPDLLEDAIDLADNGFTVSARLAGLVERDAERLSRYPVTADYFLPGGTPIAEGATLVNPDYAEVLRLLAEEGADAFYTGRIAQNIEATVNYLNDNPGYLNQRDMAAYRVKMRRPVCVQYREHDVCG